MARPQTSFADLLERARLREGWSLSELSRRLGLARASVRELLGGGDPRLSTLARCVRELAGFTPPRVLEGEASRVPADWTGAWEAQRALFGVSARRFERRVVEEPDGTLRIEDRVVGARSHGRPSASTSDLLQRLHLGPRAPLLRALGGADLAPGAELAFEHEGRTWRYEVRGRAGRPRVNARSTWTLGVDEVREAGEGLDRARRLGLWFAPELPIEEVLLCWAPRDDHPVVACAQPRSLAMSQDEARSWGRPATIGTGAARTLREGDEWRATFRRPPVGLACLLVAGEDSQGESGPRPAEPSGAGDAVRRQRSAAGLSLRSLARRAALSPQTLSGLEAGTTDARLSSLAALFEALPTLSSWSLLPWPEATPAAAALHDWSVSAFGCLVDEEHKEVEISSSGSLRIRIHFRGLRRLREATGDLSIVVGAARTVLQRRPAELDGISEDDSAGLRIARIGPAAGPTQYVIRVPEEAAREGLTFTRRFVNPGSHAMSAARARDLTGQEGPFHEGTIFGPLVPARRSLLTVKFPAGYRPADLRATAWAMNQVPDPEGEDLSGRLGTAAPALTWQASRRTARLEAERTPLGVQLALSWRLP